MQAEKRVAECIRMGFDKVILPERNLSALAKFRGKIELIPVKHIYQAIKLLFDGKAGKEIPVEEDSIPF